MKRKKKIEHTSTFICCGCEMDKDVFANHMETAHGFVKGTPSARHLVIALHGDNFYSNTYKWEIPCRGKTVLATQVREGPGEYY